jgi:hypothetical protein
LKQAGGAGLGVAILGNLSAGVNYAHASGSGPVLVNAPVKIDRIEYRLVRQVSFLNMTGGYPAPGSPAYATYQSWLDAAVTNAEVAEAGAAGGPANPGRTVVTEIFNLHENAHTGISQSSIRQIDYLDPFGNVILGLPPSNSGANFSVRITVTVATIYFYAD